MVCSTWARGHAASAEVCVFATTLSNCWRGGTFDLTPGRTHFCHGDTCTYTSYKESYEPHLDPVEALPPRASHHLSHERHFGWPLFQTSEHPNGRQQASQFTSSTLVVEEVLQSCYILSWGNICMAGHTCRRPFRLSALDFSKVLNSAGGVQCRRFVSPQNVDLAMNVTIPNLDGWQPGFVPRHD